MKTLKAADLFCGAGGSSTGLRRVADALGVRVDLTAVNHWPIAVETHAANHPDARHICESLDSVDPRKVTGGSLDLLWASPECTHHSSARGGRPISDQSRSTAWCVVRWAEALRPKWIIVENVPEYQTWAPLGTNGRPLKSRKGELFWAWVNALVAAGYHVEFRVLNAADYGAATTRRRLFVVARFDGGARGRGPIAWPLATHTPSGSSSTLFDGLPSWRAAREIIDWTERGQSIFGRKKPLADNTLRRIAAGARKFWGVELEPFLVAYHSERPGEAARVNGLNAPLPTLTTENRFGLVQPFIMPVTHGTDRSRRERSVDDPLATVTGANRGELALLEPFLLGQQSGAEGRAVSDPMPTVATKGAISLIEPFLVNFYGSGSGLIPQSVGRPLPTVTTKDRFGLVQPAHLDITFRMLRPHELAAAMGFPVDYQFAGTRTDAVKQIGNAVEVNQAAALWTRPVEHLSGARRAA
ncbi:MAG: DNA cytosine methyltransferase [Vicinamibacterales bacterium]